jgi:DNA replication protein DnaC
MNDELAQQLRYLRLPNLAARWSDYIHQAAETKLSHVKWLTQIIQDEYNRRKNNAAERRIKHARIPEPYTLDTYPFARQPRLNRKELLNLHDSLDYMRTARNVLFMGPTGCGKTGLATSLLVNAIHHGHTGRYVLFQNLADTLYRSVADHSEKAALHEYLRCDCLLLDEIGYIPLEPVQVGLFFSLIHQRHQLRRPTLITTNLGFSQWGSFLQNNELTSALLDRLTADSHIINMSACKSLRTKPRTIS